MKKSIFILTITILLSGCKNKSTQICEKLFEGRNIIIPAKIIRKIISPGDYNKELSETVDNGRFHNRWLPDWITYLMEKFKVVQGEVVIIQRAVTNIVN